MADRFASWALLELMGHRQVPGMVEEVELAGAKMLRVRVPSVLRASDGALSLLLEQPVLEQYYSPSSVYALTPTTEHAIAKLLERELRYETLPALPPPGTPPQPRCRGTGPDGKACTSGAEPGSPFCWSHRGDETKFPEDHDSSYPSPDEGAGDEEPEA